MREAQHPAPHPKTGTRKTRQCLQPLEPTGRERSSATTAFHVNFPWLSKFSGCQTAGEIRAPAEAQISLKVDSFSPSCGTGFECNIGDELAALRYLSLTSTPFKKIIKKKNLPFIFFQLIHFK